MNEQISIYSLLPTPDINDISEAEAVQIVGERLGVRFSYNDFFERWEGKRGRITMALSYSHYFPDIFEGRLFLGADYHYGDGGGSSPCDGIDEAVEYLHGALTRWEAVDGQ